MPDENTQNPNDNTFSIDQDALQANADAPAEQPAPDTANPLNTGNGTPEAPAEPATPDAPAPESPAEPVDITPKAEETTPAEAAAPEAAPTETPVPEAPAEPEDLEKKLEEGLTEATETSPDPTDTTANSKKYLIIIIVVIALLAGGYFIYTYFIAGPSDVVEESEIPTNTLSTTEPADEVTEEPSEALEELDEIVDELEDVYAPPAEEDVEVFEEAVLEEVDDSFPTLTKPVEEEPVVDEPVLDEPVVDEPVLDEPAVADEPVLGEPPVADDTTTDLKVLR